MFAELPTHLRAQVGARCHVERVPAGAWLIRQLDEDRSLFVIRTGRVEVVRESPPPAVAVGVLGPGDALGEVSLLMGTPREFSARAVRDCELFRLGRDDVLELLSYSQDFAGGLLRVLGGRLGDAPGADAGASRRPPSVLSVCVLDPSVPMAQLRAGIVAARGGGRVAVMDGTEVDVVAVTEAEAVAAFGRRLDEQERVSDHVFLLSAGEGEPPEWTRFCERQGDRLVAVARLGAAPPHPGHGPARRGCDVMLWAGADKAGVDRWLDALAPRTHQFVDPADPAPGIARAVRRLTGRSVGVVLSGGGARGLAHIGVLGELAERGIPVDRLGGCSVGALIAAMAAQGLTADEMAERCRQELIERQPFRDYTVPRRALLRGERFRAALARLFGEVRIEQLERDFFAVSADLAAAELVVHRRGRLADAVRASMALPGVLAPVADGRRTLLDGSVLNALPIDVMDDMGEGPIVAVDVTGKRWTGRRRHGTLPTIVETIGRSALLGGSQRMDDVRARAAIVVQPDTPDAGALRFERLEDMIKAGRRAARPLLDDLERRLQPIDGPPPLS